MNISRSIPHTWLKSAIFPGAGLLLCPSIAAADMLAVATGHGNIESQGSNAAFLSYQKDAPKLFSRESFYDFTLGYWNGSTRNSALSLARVVRWKLSSEYYFDGTLGIGVVDHTTDHLGTIGQFMVRLAFGRSFEKYNLSIGETHYSNGKTTLGLDWEGPNIGEYFLTVMLARKF